jgi:hypothetical protein
MDALTKSPEAMQQRILALLNGLSPENLALVERFVSVRERANLPTPLAEGEKRVSYLYPTVALPASTLDGLYLLNNLG